MRNIFNEIEQKKRAIRLAALLLAIYNILRLLSILAAPYPLEQFANNPAGIALAEYQVTLQNYLNQESARLHIQPDSLKLTIIYSACLAVGYIFFAIFLGMRKKFAKYAVVSMLLVEIIIAIVIGLQYSILPSKISILIALFLLLFLFSRNIAKEFK